MVIKMKLAAIFMLLCGFTSVASYTPSYTIVAPKMIKPGIKYLFSLMTKGGKDVEFVLEASIRAGSGPILVNGRFNLKTNEAKVLTLQIPNVLPDSSYTFFVSASRGVNFSNSSQLTVNRKVHSIFIQTDKVLYKPGQKILFRVIAINPDLKPYNGKMNVTIFDTASNKILKLVDQQNENGVITSSLQLTDITSLGKWKIQAESQYASKEMYIEVAEYVLPKFEVKVELPSYFLYNVKKPYLQKNLQVLVIAKYTYGQPVKGTARVEIKLKQWWYLEQQPKITKFVQLTDGKGDFSLTVSELKTLLLATQSWSTLDWQVISVEANVTETETGIILSGKNDVTCRTQRFQLEFLANTPDNYKPGLMFYGYLSLKFIDGSLPSLSDIQNSDGSFKSISIKSTTSYNFLSPRSTYQEKEKNFTSPLLENGYAILIFNTSEKSESLNFEASFNDEETNTSVMAYKYVTKFQTRDKGGIQITLKSTENIIKPSTILQFQVKTVDPIKDFQFQILAKGLIVAGNQVKSVNPHTEHTFAVSVTAELAVKMAPEARFVVSYVTPAGELIADSLAIPVVDYFANKISLSFSKNQTEPGDENVYLNVKTKTNSFVGLLAVDQSVLLLRSGNDITQDLVKSELLTYSEVSGGRGFPVPMGIARRKRCIGCWWPIWLGGSDTSAVIDKAGLFILSNLYIYQAPPIRYMWKDGMVGKAAPTGSGSGVPGMPGSQGTMGVNSRPPASPSSPAVTSAVRQDFPETWIWSDVIANSNGSYHLKVKVPDTITSWVASGFSVSQEVGLGLTESSAKITVIKPFFISLNLPYSIVRREEFALQVTVFNYFGQDLETEIKLLASTYFKIIKCDNKELQSTDVIKNIQVANNDGKSVYFWVVATALGQIPIEVSAHAGLAADAMKATLLVKPEGQTQSYGTSQFIQISPEKSFETDFQVALPSNDTYVAGSAVIEFSVVGDIIGSALNNIDNLLKMPYGCGEQNLLYLVPDVFLLEYLTKSGQLTNEFDQKAKEFIIAGYQRELTFQRTDGSFSAFGNSDKAGSVWLSSFVIKCFHQAKEYIPVEDSKIAATMEWIIGLQGTDGTFAEPPEGKVIHTDMQGGSSAGIALTAYILIALLENRNITLKNPTRLANSINNANKFLENNFLSYSNDPYALAIISYALHKSGSSKLSDTLALLDKLAINKDGMTYWKKDVIESTSEGIWRGPYSQAKSYNIEIASYVLMVYAEKKDISKSLPILKWLIKQRNAFGGFSSTQDTVLGLEALASFATLVSGSGGTGITVTVSANSGSYVHTFDSITKENALFVQSVQLPQTINSVKVIATGDGAALVQLNVRYNVNNANKNQFLLLDLSTTTLNKTLNLTLTASWNGSEVTGMVVVEINILTGHSLLDDGNFMQQIGSTFKKVEKSSNKVVIYLDELIAKPLKFTVGMVEELKIANVKPALVKVYRYYEPGTQATGFYSTSSGQTWEVACPQCCP